MLKNYFKIAIAVLKRRKFFTFISLFGISFTLTILMVATAFIDKVFNDKYPDKKRDRSLYINNVEERGPQSMNGGALSYSYIQRFVKPLKTPAKIAFSSNYSGTNTYVNNKKIAINYKYTDGNYWDVLEYDFTEGKPYTAKQIADAEHVAVISEDLKRDYFGDSGPVIGKYIEADNDKYRIIGVVKNVPVLAYQFYADLYLPYTLSKTDLKSTDYSGGYTAILLADKVSDVARMQKEYADVVRKVPSRSKDLPNIYSNALPYMEAFVNTGNHENSGVLYLFLLVSGFVLFVMLLPTLNLININVTRIMERSSEIGVRKAFGASSRTLVYQFIIENLILTLLGGVIGVAFSVIALSIINHANLIANLNLTINFTVLLYALLICLVFGLFSGVYPAWRMSKLNVVTALKAQ